MLSYVYILMHRPSKKFYIGQRKSKTDNIHDDFLKKYFTQSDVVKTLMEKDGNDSSVWSYKILQTHLLYESALDEENRVLRSIQKNKKFKYLNKNFQAQGAPRCQQTHRKIKNELTQETKYWPKHLDLPIGWKLGQKDVPSRRKGVIKYIHPYTLDEVNSKERPDGYLTIIEHFKNQCFFPKLKIDIWVTNGNENKRVSEYQSIEYLRRGWTLGKTANYTKKIKVTNGEISRFVESVDEIPDGFTRGQHYTNITTANTIVYNNGITHIHLREFDPIPDGFTRGIIKSGMQDKLKIFDTINGEMFVGVESQLDGIRYIKYDRNLHDSERLSILGEYKINDVKLPKNWKNYSKEKLRQILKAKLDDKNRIFIVTDSCE